MIKIVSGTIHQGNFNTLQQIMKDWPSCVRYAYQRIHKDGLSYRNDIVKACKPLYMSKLNQRYIQDAVLKAKSIDQEHALFGGRKLWKKLLTGLVTKSQWHEIRDNELYSRGDLTKQGNPNIRIIRTPEGYKLRVGLSGSRQFLHFKLYIPQKFQELLDLYSDCYDVRIKNKEGKFRVYIGISTPDVPVVHKFPNGAIGVDTNPDGLAVVETDKEGNLLGHHYFQKDRIRFAQHDKRKHDIEDLAVQVVEYAVSKHKGIVLEDLKFNDRKKGFRKFNRMRHNFIYSQLLVAIERRAMKMGVEIRKVNPAFTSIAGRLKYQEQYSLNRHTAAAFIIGRLGLGIKEKIRVRLDSAEKDKLNLAGRGVSIALTKKAYSYFRHLYRVVEVKTPGLTAPYLTPVLGNYGTG